MASAQELEARLHANRDDTAAWSLYGDWLQSQGDPRGELVALQLALAEQPDERSLVRRIARRMVEHDEAWFGPFSDGADDEAALDVQWHAGFWRRATLKSPHLEDLVGPFFDQESARFLQHLTLWVDRSRHGGPDYQPTIDALAATGPHPGIETLLVGPDRADRWNALVPTEKEKTYPPIEALDMERIGNLDALWPTFPNLRQLTVAGSEITLGRVDAPHLEQLAIVSTDAGVSAARHLTEASLPALASLELWFDPNVWEDGRLALLDMPQLLPSLRRLALKRVPWPMSILEQLASSALLAQLTEVDLSRSRLYDHHTLDPFRGLERLVVDRARLTPDVRDALESQLDNLQGRHLRDADDDFYDGVFE